MTDETRVDAEVPPFRVEWRANLTTRWGLLRWSAGSRPEATHIAVEALADMGGYCRIIEQRAIASSLSPGKAPTDHEIEEAQAALDAVRAEPPISLGGWLVRTGRGFLEAADAVLAKRAPAGRDEIEAVIRHELRPWVRPDVIEQAVHNVRVGLDAVRAERAGDDPEMPYPNGMPWFEDMREERDRLRALVCEARDAIHRLCLERGSTDGYGDLMARLSAVRKRSPC